MSLSDKLLGMMRLNDEEYDDFDEEEEVVSSRKPQREVQRPTQLRMVKKGNMEIVSGQPKTLEDVRGLADDLILGKSIVINLEKAEQSMAQRIIDFISGSCYALDGNLQRVSEFVFVVTPNATELSGEFATGKNTVDQKAGLIPA